MTSQSKIVFSKKTWLLLIFFTVHLALFNINVAEWGDSYRILRASEYIRQGTYPDDEKRPPLLSLILATRPNFIDQVTYGRLILLVFSAASFIIFMKLLEKYVSDRTWFFWGCLAIVFNNVYLYWSIRIMADVPFGFLVILMAYMWQIWGKNLTTTRLFLTGILSGIAILTRFEGYLLLFALLLSVALGGLSINFKRVLQKIPNVLVVLAGVLLTIAPYLYFRNPLTSSYFEETGGREYGLRMIAVYLVSLFAIFGLVGAFPVIFSRAHKMLKSWSQNTFVLFFTGLELLLILAWPAAVPRLFVPIIPFLVILLTMCLSDYFSNSPKKVDRVVTILGIVFFVSYFASQYFLRLQFLISDKELFIINVALQLVALIFLFVRKQKLFIYSSVSAMAFWSMAIIFMHKDIFISVKNAAVYSANNVSGRVAYNDVSSVSDWYLNYQYKKANTLGFYYNTEKRQNLDQAKLMEEGIDYLLITNEHNTTMTLDLNKRPYLRQLKQFEYVVNGQKFVTRLVEVL